MLNKLKIEISAARIADFEGVKALYLLSDDYHYQADSEEFKATTEMAVLRTKAGFAELLKADHYKVLIARLGAEIIGLVAGSVAVQQSFILAEKVVANIDEVVVDRQYSGKGLAKELIANIENYFQQQGAVEILLTVYAFNGKAKSLYEAQDYQIKSYKMSKKLEVRS
ncbi:MAG: hypothetical protein OFPII_31920 [Osedax symbiont Rs1]|nr:MAG: hypothetical protein OFPII_31920 [Osedax symbiont Rs1]